MTAHIQKPENHWRQTVSAFRAYLQQTVKLLAYKQQKVKVAVPPNPRKVSSRKPTQVGSHVRYQSKFVHLLPAGQQRPVFEPSETRRYSSPLWVGIGDAESKHERKAT